MIKRILLTSHKAGLVVGLSLFAAFTGCVDDSGGRYREHVQVETVYQDDYDYYPEYETYYSRNRHEFVYLDGGVWVRRPEPRGISRTVILAAPSVRLDFHDAPERHHATIIRSYPRTWRGPETNHFDRQERPNVQPERRDVRPEQPVVRQEPRHDVGPEHHEVQPGHPVVKQAPPEPAHPNRPNKSKPPTKKKIAPQKEHPDVKPEEKGDDHKEDRKDDKRDDSKGPGQ
jgi:hypothetical protein